MLAFRCLFTQMTLSANKSLRVGPMGRSTFPEGKRRSERIVTFLTQEERLEITRQAAEASQSLSAYCHWLFVTGLQNKPLIT